MNVDRVIEAHSFDYIPPEERSGSIVGPLFQAFHGAQGPHMGLPQMIQSRVQFGSRGAIAPIAVAAIVPLGFAIFFVQSGAAALTDLAPAVGTQIPQIVIGVVAVALAIVGYSMIVRLEGIIAYVMIVNLLALSVAAFAVLPLGHLLSNGAVTVVAFLALGDQFGFGIGIVTMLIAIPVCLITASVSFYSGSVSLLSALEAFRPLTPTARLRAWTIGIAGALAIAAGLVMPADILAGFSTFLTILGYLLIPWTAVNLTDYYLIRRGRYSITDILRSDGGIYGRWGVRGLISYGLGFAAMIPFFATSFYTGPAAKALGGADISFLIGLAVASATYALLMRKVDTVAELALVARAPINTLSAATRTLARPSTEVHTHE